MYSRSRRSLACDIAEPKALLGEVLRSSRIAAVSRACSADVAVSIEKRKAQIDHTPPPSTLRLQFCHSNSCVSRVGNTITILAILYVTNQLYFALQMRTASPHCATKRMTATFSSRAIATSRHERLPYAAQRAQPSAVKPEPCEPSAAKLE